MCQDIIDRIIYDNDNKKSDGNVVSFKFYRDLFIGPEELMNCFLCGCNAYYYIYEKQCAFCQNIGALTVVE